jgi:hypothetical protein
MCNISMTSVASVFNFGHAGVLVGYVDFRRLEVCNTNMPVVNSFFNLASCIVPIFFSTLRKMGACER